MNQKFAVSKIIKIIKSNGTQTSLLAISACIGIVLSWLAWMFLARLASGFAAIILLTMPPAIYPIAITIFGALLLLGGFIYLIDAFSSKSNKKYILCGLGAALLVTGIRFSFIVALIYTKVF